MHGKHMETSKMGGKPSSWRTLKIILPVSVALALVLSGVALWLAPQPCVLCPNPYLIVVNSVTLGSNGWVTVNMTSLSTKDFVISTVKTYWGTVFNSNTLPLGSVSLYSNNVVVARENLTLTVQFRGVTWQPTVKYTFDFLNSQGYGTSAYGCLKSPC